MEPIAILLVPAAVYGGVFAYQAVRKWLRSDTRRTKRFHKAREQHRIVPIAEATGRCRIAGKARVLDPVPSYPKRGAFLARSAGTRLTEVQRDEGTELVPVVTVTEMSRVGRFAVIDDSGVAVVEDPDAVIWYGDVPLLAVDASGSLDVKDGTEVEVVGTAQPGPLPPGLAGLGAYRGGGTAVYMRASVGEKMLIVINS